MDFLGSLALSAAIMASDCADNSDEKALRTIATYNYKTYGLDKELKAVEKKHLPEEFKRYGGLTAAVVTVVARKRIQFVWTF